MSVFNHHLHSKIDILISKNFIPVYHSEDIKKYIELNHFQ